MTHKHNKWLQILAQEDFPPKLFWSENTNFKFSVNKKEKTSTRNRVAEGTSLSTAKATPATRDWNQRHYDCFTLSKTQISYSAGFPADI